MKQKLRYIYRAWKYRFRYDKDEMKYLRSQLSKGDIVADIGAHKGVYLYWMQKLVGHSGHVYAFEPQPSLAAYLKDVASSLHYNNATIEWKGISSVHGELELIVPEPEGGISEGASFETNRKKAPAHHIIKVPVDTLDHYFNSPDRRPVKFIKCDVEGHELELFKGGVNLLKKDMPTLLFECEARHISKGSVFDVFTFLEKLGYNGYFFFNGGLTPISQFNLDKHQKVYPGNILKNDAYCNNFVFTKAE